jgi:hypothetical protein
LLMRRRGIFKSIHRNLSYKQTMHLALAIYILIIGGKMPVLSTQI